MELNLCLKKINDINFIENKKKKKNKKKIEKKIEEKISHDLKEYLMIKRNTEFKNNLRLKSKRLASKEKQYTGNKEDFYKKLEQQQNEIFCKRWTSLSKNIKINRINKYFKDNKINDEKYIFDLKKLIEEKKLKNFVIYNETNGHIETIKNITEIPKNQS